MADDFDATFHIDRPGWAPKGFDDPAMDHALLCTAEIDKKNRPQIRIATKRKIKGSTRFVGYAPRSVVDEIWSAVRAGAVIDCEFMDVNDDGTRAMLNMFCEADEIAEANREQAKAKRETKRAARAAEQERAEQDRIRRDQEAVRKAESKARRSRAIRSAASIVASGMAWGWRHAIAFARRVPGITSRAWNRLVAWTNQDPAE